MYRQPLGHERDQVDLTEPFADHECNDALTEVGVRDADDRRLAHRGVGEERTLDLTRTDPIAAGLQQIGRLTPDYAMEAVGPDGGRVARAEPAIVGERACGRVGLVPVAVEQGRGAHLERTDRLAVEGEHRTVVGDHARGDAGQRRAYRTRAALPIGAGTERDEGLGHAVPLDRALPAQRFDADEDRLG